MQFGLIIKMMKPAVIYALFTLFTNNCLLIAGKPLTIGLDDLEISDGLPALGKGYSATTNSFLSLCFDINEPKHEHSYNFEYDLLDLTDEDKAKFNLESKLSNSFAYDKIKAVVKENYQKEQPKHQAIVTLRVERLYSSFTETGDDLASYYKKLLAGEQYINFFMACGPNYVRSIKRAQELTSIISFDASDINSAQEFTKSLRLYILGDSGNGVVVNENITIPDSSFEFADDTIKESLSIETLGFGLRLDRDGSDALISTDLDEFNDIMRFGFDSMTKTNPNETGGMIYEIEAMSWVDNSEFLNCIGMDSTKVFAPVPRFNIKNAQSGSDPCPPSSPEPDDSGKCCSSHEMVKTSRVDEMGQVVETMKCEPKRALSTQEMQFNMRTNAEFVSWLASVNQAKHNTLTKLRKCINKVRTIPERYNYMYLLSNNNGKFDRSIDLRYTVKELKLALDPATSLEILTLLTEENDEFYEMFYLPCLSALNAIKDGEEKISDPKFIMAEPWYNLMECMRPSCLENNMVWDRKNGKGCVPGILGRNNATQPISYDSDPHCAKKFDAATGGESCKYGMIPFNNIVLQMDRCREVLPKGYDGRERLIDLSISDLMEYFCLPKVAVNRDPADAQKMDEVDGAWEICMMPVDETLPSLIPTQQPSLLPSSLPSSQPSSMPSSQHSSLPSSQPSSQPSLSSQPSSMPSSSSQPSISSSPT